jgi:hypothetical protein
VACVRLIRHWVLSFLQTCDLLHPQYSGTHSTALEDEDISQEIQFELAQKKKTGSIKATDLVDVVASLRIQEKFNNVGINKPSICERTAHCWLSKLGWRYGKQVNSMYIDGHNVQTSCSTGRPSCNVSSSTNDASTSGTATVSNSHPPVAFLCQRPLAVSNLSSSRTTSRHSFKTINARHAGITTG